MNPFQALALLNEAKHIIDDLNHNGKLTTLIAAEQIIKEELADPDVQKLLGELEALVKEHQ